MSFIKFVFSLIVLLIGCFGFTQENFTSFGESGIDLNHKVSNSYRVNFSARSRYFLYDDEEFNLKSRQIDFVHFSTFALNFNRSISLGIQYRFRETFDGASNELRLTQQYNYTKRVRALRYGHRVRLEQRIFNDFAILRYRYRFALDFPLNGEKLDVGEGYLIASMEALLSNSAAIKPELDHRTALQLGWMISNSVKLQGGLEYRFEAWNLETDHILFFLTSAIISI